MDEHAHQPIEDRRRTALGRSVHQPSHPLLVLQRQIGNAAVARLAIQRDGDDESDNAVVANDQGVDPAAADANATVATADGTADGDDQGGSPPAEALAAAFDSDDIVGTMAGSGLGAGDLAPGAIPGDDPQTAQATVQASATAGWSVQRDPPAGADSPGPATRQASVGDLLSALAALPDVKSKLDQLKALALELLKAALSSTGGKVATVSVALGAGAAVTAIDPTRKLEFGLLNGKQIPVPIPGLRDSLSIRPIAPGGQLQGATLLFDVGKWIPGMH